MKKFACLFAALSLACAFTACGDDSSDDDSSAKAAVGEACDSNDACADGLVCKDKKCAKKDDGAADEKAKKGEDCSKKECADGLVCGDDKKCAEKPADDSKAKKGEDCSDKILCDEGLKCDDESKKCVEDKADEGAKAKKGEACSDKILCDEGLKCDDESKKCVEDKADEGAKAKKGEACSDKILCDEGLKCDDESKKCVEDKADEGAKAKKGEACSDKILCDEGLKCDDASKKCVEDSGEGNDVDCDKLPKMKEVFSALVKVKTDKNCVEYWSGMVELGVAGAADKLYAEDNVDEEKFAAAMNACSAKWASEADLKAFETATKACEEATVCAKYTKLKDSLATILDMDGKDCDAFKEEFKKVAAAAAEDKAIEKAEDAEGVPVVVIMCSDTWKLANDKVKQFITNGDTCLAE